MLKCYKQTWNPSSPWKKWSHVHSTRMYAGSNSHEKNYSEAKRNLTWVLKFLNDWIFEKPLNLSYNVATVLVDQSRARVHRCSPSCKILNSCTSIPNSLLVLHLYQTIFSTVSFFMDIPAIASSPALISRAVAEMFYSVSTIFLSRLCWFYVHWFETTGEVPYIVSKPVQQLRGICTSVD